MGFCGTCGLCGGDYHGEVEKSIQWGLVVGRSVLVCGKCDHRRPLAWNQEGRTWYFECNANHTPVFSDEPAWRGLQVM